MIKTADCDADAVKQLVQSHVPAAQLLSNVGSEIAFQLPLGATSAFPHMLQAIEEQQRQVGIDDYGLSVTTMEEVFLRVRAGTSPTPRLAHTRTRPCGHTLPTAFLHSLSFPFAHSRTPTRLRRAGTSKRLK